MIFRIEDGETHFVSAESVDDAYLVMAEEFGFQSVQQYIDNQSPSIRPLEPDRFVCVREDSIPLPDNAPSNARVLIQANAKEWSEKVGRGIVSSTCF